MRSSVLSILFSCVLGCGGPASGDPENPGHAIRFLPLALSTNVDPSVVPSIFLESHGAGFDVLSDGRFADAISLESWPDGLPIPITTEVAAQSVRSVPSAPLETGWYRFRLGPTANADAFEIHDRWSVSTTAAGYDVLFHVGSLPLMWVVVGTESAETPGVASVAISSTEPLVLVPGTDVENLLTVTFGTVPSSCHYVTQTELAPCCGDRRGTPVLDLELAGRLMFSCAPADFVEDMRITVRTGLTSVTGVPLRDLEGNLEPTAQWNVIMDGRFSPHVLSPSSPIAGGR